jgi:hypothetical protein
MKRLVGVILVVSVLILVLAIPATATRPTEVSGKWTAGSRIGPPQVEPRGKNCLITLKYWHEWGIGSFRGEDEIDLRIMEHGPCEDSAPNVFRENLKGTGTFEGDLCLSGVWEGTACSGEGYSGSFDFTLQWQVTPDPDPEADTFKGNIVILQGYDGFQDLHGVLECWGRVGAGGGTAYKGRVHVDP